MEKEEKVSESRAARAVLHNWVLPHPAEPMHITGALIFKIVLQKWSIETVSAVGTDMLSMASVPVNCKVGTCDSQLSNFA